MSDLSLKEKQPPAPVRRWVQLTLSGVETVASGARTGVADPLLAIRKSGAWIRARWTADLALFSILLVLTGAFGRPFSKIGLHAAGHKIYVTELFLLGTIVLALARCRWSGTLDRVRRSIPLTALLVLWLAGAVATIRGLVGFGFTRILPDVGLVEYSVCVPIVALIADTRERALRLVNVLIAAGAAAALIDLMATHVIPTTLSANSEVAVYFPLAIFLPLAAALMGMRIRPAHVAAVALALAATASETRRAPVVAFALGLVALIVLLPRRRLAVAAVSGTALVLAICASWLFQTTAAPTSGVASASDFRGGRLVSRVGSSDLPVRRLRPGGLMRVPLPIALVPHWAYTVLFEVKPLSNGKITGKVGNPAGGGWARYWKTAPVKRWQYFRETFVATGSRERLAFSIPAAPKRRASNPQGPVLIGPVWIGRPGLAPLAPTGLGVISLSDFAGGRLVHVGGSEGPVARRLLGGQDMQAPRLIGLEPRRAYTVSFEARPMGKTAVAGTVGDTSTPNRLLGRNAAARKAGYGWGARRWSAAHVKRWQRFRGKFIPTASTERLAVYSYGPVFIRAFRITPPPDLHQQATPPWQARSASWQASLPPILRRLGYTFNSSSDASGNVRWRLDFWRFAILKALHEPVLGVGFGRPSDFKYGYTVWDTRTGNPNYLPDVVAPHNSFVNLFYRTGLLGLVPFLFIVAVAIRRLIRARRNPDDQRSRAALIGLGVLFVTTSITAATNVALEGPYMAIFFWTILGLLLVLPRLADGVEPAHRTSL